MADTRSDIERVCSELRYLAKTTPAIKVELNKAAHIIEREFLTAALTESEAIMKACDTLYLEDRMNVTSYRSVLAMLRARSGEAGARASCPDCYRFKARNADDCAAGDCAKWYAIRDPEAATDCKAFKNRTGYYAKPAGDAGAVPSAIAPQLPADKVWDVLTEMAYQLRLVPRGDIVPAKILAVLKEQYRAAMRAYSAVAAPAEAAEPTDAQINKVMRGTEWLPISTEAEAFDFAREMVKTFTPKAAAPEDRSVYVRFGSMKESNGRETWIVSLVRAKAASVFDGLQVYASEIKGRAEYEADRLRHFLDGKAEPDILLYDTAPPKAAAPKPPTQNLGEYWRNPPAPKAAAPEDRDTLDTAERVCFYEQEFYPLSNFSAFRLLWKNVLFETSEHAYHTEKFSGQILHQHAIHTSPSAHEAFKYAEKHKADRRPDWDAVKVGIMRDILRTKAQQHEYVRRKLLESGDRELVENSWRDDFWGWGPNRDGQNMLGKLWMEVRAELRSSMNSGGKS